jgi:hypothetical protein
VDLKRVAVQAAEDLGWAAAKAVLGLKRPATVAGTGLPESLLHGEVAFGKVGERRLYFPPDDNRHKLFVGPSRSGKTENALQYALGLARAGRGLCYMDCADGEALDRLRDGLDAPSAERLVVLDFGDLTHPMPIGIDLQGASENAVDEVVTWWADFFSRNYGLDQQFATQEILHYACKTAFSVPGATLLEVVAVVADPGVRARFLDELPPDSDVRDWWLDFESRYSGDQQANLTASFLRRAHLVLANTALRNMVCQRPHAPMEWRRWMDENRVVLVRVPESLGPLAVRTAMSLVLLNWWAAALSRGPTAQKTRQRFTVIADEPQTWLRGNQDLLDGFFSRSAKYGLLVVCLFQSLHQVSRESSPLLPIILDNNPDLLLFEDAVKQVRDVNLPPVPRYHFIAKVCGQAPFAAEALGVVKPVAQRADVTGKWLSTYGRPVGEVRQDISLRKRGFAWQETNSSAQRSESPGSGSKATSGPGSPRGTSGSSKSSVNIGW